MKLITELQEDVQITLVEETTGKKSYCIEGIFLQADIQNKNGRRYPSHIMEAEVNRYIADKVDKRRAYGELGHPAGPSINLDRVSHLITSLVREGNNWYGKAKITEGTQYGATVKGLLDAGANLGVSSRALGSLRNVGGIMEVQDDFRLSTAGDIVADPSAPDAFVNGIMEGMEWVRESGIWTPKKIDEARLEIERACREPNKLVFEETAARLFRSFLKTL